VDAAIGGVNDWLADGVSGGSSNEASREVVTPINGVENHDGAGMGRLVTLNNPVGFDDLVARLKRHLGLRHVQVAVAGKHRNNGPVSSVAICAGSGSSVLRGVKADVHFTGELSHHEALHLKENGLSAIVCGHSNTERGFLPALKKQLESQFAKDGQVVDITISAADKDPLEIV
jgi:putative NIF3 family GTP cyclohydrolase 1 type 2